MTISTLSTEPAQTTPIRPSVTIELPSRLDIHLVPWLTAMIDGALAQNPRSVTLDGSLVKHLDAAGLAALVETRRRVEHSWTLFHLIPNTTIQVACALTAIDLIEVDADNIIATVAA